MATDRSLARMPAKLISIRIDGTAEVSALLDNLLKIKLIFLNPICRHCEFYLPRN